MKKHAFLPFYLLLAALLAQAAPGVPGRAAAQGVETRVLIRAVSQDAKVLHDGVGGARITVRDLATGHLLARGVQTGTSGSTERIMQTPHARGAAVYDAPGTAGYLATLYLDRPTPVEIVAEGPLDSPQATQRAAKTMLLVPGRHVLGEGVLLTIHGFIVTLLAPEGGVVEEDSLRVRATVTMSCGCPTEPGGLWDAGGIDVVARLVRDGAVLQETPLRYAGERSTYEGRVPVPRSREGLTLEVLAMDADTANFGMDARRLQAPKAPSGGTFGADRRNEGAGH